MSGLNGNGAGFYPAFVVTAAGAIDELILVRGQLFNFRTNPGQTMLFLGMVHHKGIKVSIPCNVQGKYDANFATDSLTCLLRY